MQHRAILSIHAGGNPDLDGCVKEETTGALKHSPVKKEEDQEENVGDSSNDPSGVRSRSATDYEAAECNWISTQRKTRISEKGPRRRSRVRKTYGNRCETWKLLLPGALLVTVSFELFAALVLINFCFTAFFQRSHRNIFVD
jgi:hypothetical protein